TTTPCSLSGPRKRPSRIAPKLRRRNNLTAFALPLLEQVRHRLFRVGILKTSAHRLKPGLPQRAGEGKAERLERPAAGGGAVVIQVLREQIQRAPISSARERRQHVQCKVILVGARIDRVDHARVTSL